MYNQLAIILFSLIVSTIMLALIVDLILIGIKAPTLSDYMIMYPSFMFISMVVLMMLPALLAVHLYIN